MTIPVKIIFVVFALFPTLPPGPHTRIHIVNLLPFLTQLISLV